MINKSEKTIFNLNGVNINCSIKYKWSFIPKLNYIVSHIEFKSLTVNKANDISDTGYRSAFIQSGQHEDFKDINDFIGQYIEFNNIKVYNLDYEEKEEAEELFQCSLF